MARVDTVEDRHSGIKVHINLDKKQMIFSAEFADWSFSHKDGEKVREETIKAIRERVSLTWTPVIEVYQENNYASIETGYGRLPMEQHETMGLRINRFYAARKLDGHWIRAKWDTPADQRLYDTRGWRWMDQDATEIKYTAHHGTWMNQKTTGEFVFPYSEELWAGLEEVIRAMRRIRQLVKDLLNDEEGIQKLISVGAGNVPLLGGGSSEN